MHDSGMRRWALVLFAILAAVAIGTVTYQAGVSHGLALQPPVAVAPPAAGAPPVAQAPYPYYPYGLYRHWGFGFGGLLSLFFWIFVLRAIFGWGPWGWRRRWDYHREYWPERFDDWHRRAHERMRPDAPASPPAAS